ncbi:MAG: non-canonical purine NTP pyrophosphatase [Phycisphaerae bacterium]|nr:non-canonical purine NTP pyrophosphatase [Phycisphaerae bacterium]
MRTIVLATSNPHKVEEIGAIFRGIAAPFRLIGLMEAADWCNAASGFPEPPEIGATFEANARIKACAYATHTKLPCLADDSGLEIDALGGRPGVISSHFSSDGLETGLTRLERDRLNIERVLRELGETPDAERSARFVCVMCLALPPRDERAHPRIVAESRGTFEGRIGRIGHVPRGTNGFGYDPIFLVSPGFDRTSAELTRDEKNRLSHRGSAARNLVAALPATDW